MTDTSTSTDASTDSTSQSTDTVDWKAEAEKWKTLADQTEKRAKRHEDAAKTNAAAAKELEKLREQSMSDVEKAAAQARAEGRSDTLRTVGGKLVAAEFKAAAARRDIDDDTVAAIVEVLDVTKFLTADGEPDVDAIVKLVEGLAPDDEGDGEDERPGPAARVPQGPRGSQSTTALNGDPLLRSLKSKLGIR